MANVANVQHAALTSTSYVDIVAAPSSGNKRIVSVINVANTDTGNPISVTITLDDTSGATLRVLVPLESIDASSYRQFGPYVLTNVAGTAPQKIKAKLSGSGTVDVVASFADA